MLGTPPEPASGVSLLGREVEVETLEAFLGPDAAARALVLRGGPGIGKTALWDAGVGLARERGLTVLIAQPSGAETRLALGGLIDLCDELDEGALDTLPAPQRHALEVALLRRDPGRGGPPGHHAIVLAFRNLLRALSGEGRGPLIVAIDDVQWLDPPSAEALTFAARRLTGDPVRFLLARRAGRRPSLELAIDQHDLAYMEVGPLDVPATRVLLQERLGLTLRRPLLQRIVDLTLGNPLFSLEVGRALQRDGVPELGGEIPVPRAVEDMLSTRVVALPPDHRRVLLAVALSGDLRPGELAAVTDRRAIDEAIDSGLLRVDGNHVRAAHPLLAAAAKKRSRQAERRELHLALAEAIADDELSAMHLASASDRPDVVLANEVATAAAGAAARGAAVAAVRLAEHALRLTPADHDQRAARLLTLGSYLETAGQRQRVTDLLTPEVTSLPTRDARVRAWLLLCDGAAVKTYAQHQEHIDRALAEAGDDPELRALVLARKAISTVAEGVQGVAQAEAWATESLPENSGAGRDVELVALRALGWSRTLAGRAIDDVCERFAAATETAVYLTDSPDPVCGLRLTWRGEVAGARDLFTRYLALSDERGEAVSYAWMRLNMCELGLRTGDFDDVEERLDEWAESNADALLITPTYQRCRGLLAAGRGHAEEAEKWAAPALAESQRLGYRWQILEASRALGTAALLAHNPKRAASRLRSVWSYTEREGITDPGAFPVAPDLVEALVQNGDTGEALEVTRRVSELATAQDHPWGLATAKRCGAVIALAARTYDEDAAARLGAAADRYETLGLKHDAARSLLALGRAQRRRRKWGAARETLDRAIALFEEQGAGGWVAQARAELERVGARKPRPTGELSPAEQRVAELARDGLANKEIAATLHITVHTVELHLTRSYAKLGIRSRTQLAQRLKS